MFLFGQIWSHDINFFIIMVALYDESSHIGMVSGPTFNSLIVTVINQEYAHFKILDFTKVYLRLTGLLSANTNC